MYHLRYGSPSSPHNCAVNSKCVFLPPTERSDDEDARTTADAAERGRRSSFTTRLSRQVYRGDAGSDLGEVGLP